jgi:hypothetical protein
LPDAGGVGQACAVRALSGPWLALSALTLSLALQISDGFYNPITLPWLGLALLMAVLGTAGVRWPWGDPQRREAVTSGLLAAGVIVSAVGLLSKPVAMYMRDAWPWHHPALVLPVALATAAALLSHAWRGRRPAVHTAAAALVLAGGVWVGAWTIRMSPAPRIDVMPVHEDAFRALARGSSPYAITFEDIYKDHEQFYAPEMREGKRIMFGFPYPPLSLLLAWPGEALLGDLRYAEVAALVVAALLLIGVGRRVSADADASRGLLCASAILLAPRVIFQIEQGWTEPFPIALLAATVAVGVTRPRLAWIPLGLLMASKQHLAVALVFVPMLARGSWRSQALFAVKALGVAAVVTLPIALLDWDAFMRSAVLLQLREPFRMDALSFTRMLVDLQVTLDKERALAISLAAGLFGVGLSWWRAPRTPAGFAAAVGLTCFLLAAFGKKAFLNYYFLVVAALLTAVAALPDEPADGYRPATPASASNASGDTRPQ